MEKRSGLPRCSKKGNVMENLLTFLKKKNIKGVFAILFKFLVGIS